MSRGGRRPGAGRKTNAQIQAIRNILTDTLNDAQWKHLFCRLHELALNGNVRAAQLLLTYRFGDPYAEPATEAQEIHTIEVHVPYPRPRTLRRSMPVHTISGDNLKDATADDPPRSMPAHTISDDNNTEDSIPAYTPPNPTPAPKPIPYPRVRYHGDETDDLGRY